MSTRVRVTGPARGRRPRPVAVDLDEQSRLGEVYLSSLVRSQLRLGLGVAAVLVATIGVLPVVFLVPAVQRAHVAGVPLAWLVLGGGCYPLLVALAWVYVRRAEQNERDFADLVEPARGRPRPGEQP